MRIAAIQHDIAWEDAPTTRKHVGPMIEQAVSAGARLIVLPEMFATGFSMSPERTAEEPGGETERFLTDAASQYGVWLVASVAQWAPAADDAMRRAHNTAVLAGPAGQLSRYHKIHPFTYGGEDRHYLAGQDLLTVDVEGLRVSVLICYDLRFADEFWQLADRTDLYVVPANWPTARAEHWRILLRARAIENQAYVVGCNRVGTAGDADHPVAHRGDSVIIDPLGRTLVEASHAEAVLLADVDPGEVAAARARFGFLADRRPSSAERS
jgi:predicted amidohydrolase